MAGALQDLRIIELAGIGPGPFAAMMLADHGAEVIRVERPGARDLLGGADPLQRSRRSLALDLKRAEAVDVLRDLVRTADGLIEGFRPGVMERLGLGPDVLLADNPRLVYGRMTGWGQDGPLAQAAGHDINYIALSGALHLSGRAGDKPTPAMNLVGDFGGGGMMLAFGMLAALIGVQRTGKGQMVDAAMTEGSALLSAMQWGMHQRGLWADERGVNLFDTGAPFYDTYACADGAFIAVGALEPQFYALLLEKTGLSGDPLFALQMDRSAWPAMRERLTQVFASRTRADWCALMEGSDACFAPVLSLADAPAHPHNAARDAFIAVGGVTQPAPAPRLSATPAPQPSAPRRNGEDSDAVLAGLGYSPERVGALRAAGIIG